ncbi:MAG: hypothetical protein WC212_02490 [Candidatus Delongbacteria bacterium]|nr:hypothetical protein [Candidatus Delongbacteria bacterium]
MFKISALLLTAFMLITSCAGTSGDKRTGTGKPKFASLEIDGVSYFLTSENGTFAKGKPLDLTLRMKNMSRTVKTFKIENNRFVILQINNEYGVTLKTFEIKASDYLKEPSFGIDPDEEKIFTFSTGTNDSIFEENDRISCTVRLYFLQKTLRRNALSIYLDKK